MYLANKMKDIKEFSRYIGYGVGVCYEKTKAQLAAQIKLDYLCDRQWDNSIVKEYDGIPVLQRENINDIRDALVIIFAQNETVENSIKNDLQRAENDISFVSVFDILGRREVLTGKKLKEMCKGGLYADEYNNRITFDVSLPDEITIVMCGNGNSITFGKNLVIGKCSLHMGNNGHCFIGEGTQIQKAELLVSEATLRIGMDCLISYNVSIRTHDHHHIFDRISHKRINYAKDVIIGNNVWLAYGVHILAGAVIGEGSIVGANAITSSQFGDHKIIVGSPAKIIRENICWSKDSLDYFNHEYLEECVSKEALKYL